MMKDGAWHDRVEEDVDYVAMHFEPDGWYLGGCIKANDDGGIDVDYDDGSAFTHEKLVMRDYQKRWYFITCDA